MTPPFSISGVSSISYKATSNFVSSVFHMYSEPTDKVYFRKKDEVSNYAEFMFKAKILLNKK